MKVWDAFGNLLIDLSEQVTSQVISVRWSNDSQKVAFVLDEQQPPVRIYNISTPTIPEGALMDIFTPPIGKDGFFSDMEWSGDDTKLIITARATDTNFVIWDVNLRQAITVSNQGWTEVMSISPDGNFLILADINSPPALLNLVDMNQRQVLIGTMKDTYSIAIAWSSTGSYIALGSRNGDVKVYNAVSLELLKTMPVTSTDYVNKVEFSSDETKLLSSNANGLVQIWDVQTGLLVREINFNRLISSSFNPIDDRLAFNNPGGLPIVLPLWDAPLPLLNTPTPSP